MTGRPRNWPCPCCGYLVFSEPPGSYEICDVCGWEDDLSQLRFAAEDGGPNGLSLLEAQARFASRREALQTASYARDPDWRPLDPDRDQIEIPEPGKDYGRSYATDRATYYYWRQASPRN